MKQFEIDAGWYSVKFGMEGAVTTLEDILQVNADDDVEGLTEKEKESLEVANVGDIVSVGMVEVKRIK